MAEAKKFFFYNSKYPFMDILVEPDQTMMAGHMLKTIPARYVSFSHGKLEVYSEEDAAVVEENIKVNPFIRKISTEAEFKKLPDLMLKSNTVRGAVGTADMRG